MHILSAMDILLERYAELIVKSALKLEKGDVLSINTEEENSELAHSIARIARDITGNGSYIQNIENGKVTEHNFDAMVDNVAYSSYSDEGVFLNVRTISDKQPSASTTLQYYGEDGNISVDLQDLLPGADDVEVAGEYVILKSPATINVYNTDGELLGSADASAVTFQDGYFVRSGSTTIVYNLEGEQVFSGKTSSAAYGEKEYFDIANGMIYYTITREGTETTEGLSPSSTTTVYTYSEADGDKTLGEGEIRNGNIVYLYNSSSEDYTAYIMGYTNSVAAGLASAGALNEVMPSPLDDVPYTLYSYTETVTSGSGHAPARLLLIRLSYSDLPSLCKISV